MQPLLWAIPILCSLVAGALLLRSANLRRRSLDRIEDLDDSHRPATATSEEEERGPLGVWLALAGFREKGASDVFVALTLTLLVVGLLTAFALRYWGLLDEGSRSLQFIPGVIGELFIPIMYAAPFIVVVILAAVPWLVVRRARRKIVESVEQDLPLVLELLATLGEAGLGFDSGIAQVVASQPANRPLTAELRTFQREVLTGRPRVESLRRVAKRLDVSSLTIFISAVVQAEQVGAGVSDVLRHQAEDARDRRRDRALSLAQSLPVKLLFPLVICFLPAIFAVTLGPIFMEFLKFADAIMSKRVPQ
jgi:tight adherence protein C